MYCRRIAVLKSVSPQRIPADFFTQIGAVWSGSCLSRAAAGYSHRDCPVLTFFRRLKGRSGKTRSKSLILMVPLPRLERGTPRSTIWCSNQLSYSGVREAALNSVFGQTSSTQIRIYGSKTLRLCKRVQEPENQLLHLGAMLRSGWRGWPSEPTERQGAKAPELAARRSPSAGARTGSGCRALP